MKIGIDIRALMDEQYSGVPEYTVNLIKEMFKLDSSAGLEQARSEYQLFYNRFGDISERMRIKCGPARDNVKIIDYHYPNKILNYFFFKFFNWPKIDKKLGADVFFMPHINFIGMSRGARSIITVHDLSFLRYPEFFSWRKNFWHSMINVKKLLDRFSQIVAVSENTKKDIVELCEVNPDKVRVIYSGVGKEYRRITNHELPAYRQGRRITNSNTERERLMETKDKYSLSDKFILYLGTVEPRKNVDGIIKAYNELRVAHKELREVKLVLAGSKGWKSKKAYQEWGKSEFKDDIKFLGYIDTEDKAYLYNLASVFVYPSFYEGFGLPLLEAMASGLPVVSSFSSSLPEVAGDAALMVDPYNVNDIAGALAEVLSDENLRNRLSARGLERAKQFSWEKTAREYLGLFKNFQKI